VSWKRQAQAAVSHAKRKQSIVIIARQHAGEVVGSWKTSGLLRFLLGASAAAAALRAKYCIRVVPMVNIDGVLCGNSRCTLAGVDPNRVWQFPNPILHPEMYSLKEHIRRTHAEVTVAAFLDLHGHSHKLGSFFYGCGHTEMKAALMPKLVS
jgi:murein tripeptide amidase MpaA